MDLQGFQGEGLGNTIAFVETIIAAKSTMG
jgi:hypothetical protein